MKRNDLVGRQFNQLTVLEFTRIKNKHTMWLCLCSCGKTKEYDGSHLTRKKHPVVSCGCYRKTGGKEHRNSEYVGEISGDWWTSRVTRGRGVRTKKIEVSITREYVWDLFLKQNGKCALSGIKLLIHKKTIGTASLDRIDSSKGYIEGNVQWVHKDINKMKNVYSMEYFILLCKSVASTNN
jgi:hypothetical protein